jgi:hypothetical protein
LEPTAHLEESMGALRLSAKRCASTRRMYDGFVTLYRGGPLAVIKEDAVAQVSA